MAWSLPSLIFFRILQGGTSGPMIPGSQALLISIFPAHKRATALGIWSITTLVAPICGPILGGYISDNYHWGWIFLINVPVGLVVTLRSLARAESRETPTRKLPIDMVGLGLLIVWVGALQIMLDTGKDADWFSSTTIVVEAIITVVGFHRLPDLGADREASHRRSVAVQEPQFRAWDASAFCLGYAVFFANNLLMPLWLQTQIGYTATWAGLVAAPTGAIAVLLTPFSARMMAQDRCPHHRHRRLHRLRRFLFDARRSDRRCQLLRFRAAASGAGHRHGDLLPGHDHHPAGWRAAAAHSAGVGPLEFRAHHRGRLCRLHGHHHVGPPRSACIRARMADLTTAYSPAFNQALAGLHRLGLPDLGAKASIARIMTGQAYLLSADDIFWVSGWVCFPLIGMVWLCRKAKSGGGAPVAAD